MKVGVLRFPGTNCDRDVVQALLELKHEPVWLWHQDHFEGRGFHAFIIPGGFSYGDYLRSGALAARAPAMQSLISAAKSGAPVLGICNGFQILTEAGLLPGALLKNESGRFNDRIVGLKPVGQSPYFAAKVNATIELPIAHGDGRFFCEEGDLKRLFDHEQVWFTYEQNPNGSAAGVAGVLNRARNVCALMPHPERAIYTWQGNAVGREFFKLEF